MIVTRTRARHTALALLLVSGSLTACGTRLTHHELDAGNGIVTQGDASGDSAAAPTQVADPASVDPTTAAASGGTDAGAATSPATGDGGGALVAPPSRPAGSGDGAASTAPAATSGGASKTPGAVRLTSAAASSTAPAAGSRPPLVLGTYGTESGLIGANVVSMPAGLHAWLADVNARGGISGRKVQIIFGGDDQGDPSKALAITQKLVEQDHVAGLIGTYDPAGGETGVIDYINSHHIPVIGDTSDITPADQSPYFFIPQTAYAANAKGFVTTFTTQTALKKLALIYLGESTAPQSAATIKSYAPSQGIQLVYSAQVSIAQPSYTAEVLNARNAGAEGVILVMDYTSARRYIQQASQQGWHPQFGGSFAFDQPIPPGDASLMNGLLAYSVTANFQSATTADYRAAIAKYVPGGAQGFLGPVAFAAGKTVEAAGPYLGSGAVGPAELLSALYQIKPTNLNGYVPTFSFKQGGHPYLNLCLQPTKLVDGQWSTPVGYKCVT